MSSHKRISNVLVVAGCGLVLAGTAKSQPPEACSGPLFDNPEYAVGNRPVSAATGDLDGDGDLDLVTTNLHEGTISVLLNNGDGTFADHVKYEAGFEPASVAIGDLDDDGDLDLVVSSGGGADLNGNLPGTVSILLNPGDGTFLNQTIHDLGIGPFSVALGDLDGDDDLDMAIAVRESDIVQIMFNNGNGTFVFGPDIPAGDHPSFVVIGDLDDDDDLDLAVTSWTENVVSVFLNNGGGSFAGRVTYPAGSGPSGLAVGDLDGDGDLDLAAANLGPAFNPGTTVSVLLNSGNATFAMPVPYGVGQAPSSVIITDLDADGDADLALTNLNDDTTSVLLNNGDATFADDVRYTAGDGPAFVAAGDFDGDLDLDLAVTNEFRNTLSILHAHGDGTFQDVVNLEVGAGPSAVAIADLDGDGDLDLAVANRGGCCPFPPGTVSVLLNQGDGTFAERGTFGTGIYPESVAIGDLDGDGDRDEARSWIFGDPLHSRPLPLNYGARDGYTIGNPAIYLAVASNDGFLHFIRNTEVGGAESGEEIWAFMPRATMGSLKTLRANAKGVPHPYALDGSPVAYIEDSNYNGTI
ncbi:MAG: VCBS repeat-containing protein, partial [Planctomycetes bacterium]|nr:VCBS repeat-containing protein [Planctomycetota bacterium]